MFDYPSTIRNSNMLTIKAQELENILDAVENNKFIQSIKLLREYSPGLGLREAKDIMDQCCKKTTGYSTSDNLYPRKWQKEQLLAHFVEIASNNDALDAERNKERLLIADAEANNKIYIDNLQKRIDQLNKEICRLKESTTEVNKQKQISEHVLSTPVYSLHCEALTIKTEGSIPLRALIKLLEDV